MSWFVYMLKCADGSLYTGVARDTGRRLEEHNSGKGAKYTRGRTPVRLVYTERCLDQSRAVKRELAIKRMSRSRKLELARER
ncbi:MAG: GIY-YIG nuclease family protein [Arenicellales bacterium]|jgi:putative endonuclease